MIYIDISRLSVSQEWKDEAQKLTYEMMNISEDERSEIIRNNSHVWRDLKPELERISFGKCWYCEAKNTREDFRVDHFRPKNKVKNPDGTKESGYWWLAFDYQNFRLACSYCNCLHTGGDRVIRGKSDKFPLHPNCTRARSPDSNIDDELPFLIDPIKTTDPSLLWFQDDGKACPRFSENAGFLFQKASISIDILNLNDTKIVEKRKSLWIRCISLVQRGDRVFSQRIRGSPSSEKEFQLVVEEMHSLTEPSSEFSATARACLWGCALEWVRAIV